MADLVCPLDVRSHGENRKRGTVRVSRHCSGTGLPDWRCWAKEMGLLNRRTEVGRQGNFTPGLGERTTRRFMEDMDHQACEDFNINGRGVEEL